MCEFGLNSDEIRSIQKIAQRFPAIEKLAIFGSRAKGTHKRASDIDMVVSGPHVTAEMILELQDLLEEETLIPYFFDVIRFETIQSEELIDHINRVGKPIYKR